MLDTISETFNRILSVFSTFSFTDFLDIVFVTLVIYLCVRIIRESRAMQFLKAIVFVIVIYVIVNILNMEASSYIFEKIFQNILLIIIVLFAPEIRTILEQLGKGAARNGFKNLVNQPSEVETMHEVKDCIEAVTRACADMSDSKTGALIVFENQTLLGNIIDSGIMLNAKATTALIENIFYPKTPLHDGALIIRQGKLYAAGCILPLTDKSVSASLGTRHRAAIGLTEECDAICVVVSEETGYISVTQKGKINRDISDGDLRDILTKNFITDVNNANAKKKKNRPQKKKKVTKDE